MPPLPLLQSTRPLGATGVTVPLLGYGTGPLGKPEISPEYAARCLNRAIDLGITYLDTSPDYGSEPRVGEVMRTRRDEVFLATKVNRRRRIRLPAERARRRSDRQLGRSGPFPMSPPGSPSPIPATMRAMVLDAPRTPLQERELLVPAPAPGQVLIRVHACAVCRTDLHIVDGELPRPKVPLVPGHQIVGTVAVAGREVEGRAVGDRVGVPWLGWTDGTCPYCRSGRENLCDGARFTGYDLDGGYAEYVVADARFCFPIPAGYPDIQAAPLLCAGLIGYRALGMTGDAGKLGLYGFGAAAHIICQVAIHQGRQVYAVTRAGDEAGQAFARELGAVWSGDAASVPPELEAAIIFAPAGELVPAALGAVVKGGVVVCAGIHMSPIPSFPYDLLWGERVLRSVANLTRRDGEEFLALAPRIPVRTEVQT